jgi:hypothetical protein
MKHSFPARLTIIVGVALSIAGVVALVVFLPLIAALAFLLLTAVASLSVGRKEGHMKAFVTFLKEAVFGW